MEDLSNQGIEILNTYDVNYANAEKFAFDAITSVETALFSFLRDFTPSSMFNAMYRMNSCFGKERKMEHCLFLTIITDYVSCAYNTKWFYNTFDKDFSPKFIDSFFTKLYVEWQKIFAVNCYIEFSVEQLNSVRKILRRSAERFPETFRFKKNFEDILKLCEKYIDFKSRMAVNNTVKKPIDTEKTAPAKSVVKNTSNLARTDFDCEVVAVKIPKTAKNGDMTRYMVRKENIVPTNGGTSPTEVKESSSVAPKVKSLSSSPLQLSQENPAIVVDISKIIDRAVPQISDTTEVPLQSKRPKNAFDILMRRSVNSKPKAVF